MVDCNLDISAEVKKLDPPSARDREIFRAVIGLGQAQEVVAQTHEITQARVSQIVAAVREWLSVATDAEAEELPPERQLRYGQRVVRMRLEALLSLAMGCFQESKGLIPETKQRESSENYFTEATKKTSFGDLKYLTHYRQVALTIAKLDGVNIAPRAEMQQATAKAEATAAQQPSGLGSAVPPAMEKDLYRALEQILERRGSAACEGAVSNERAATSAEAGARKSSSPDIAAGQKTAYKTDQASQRQAFLRGAPVAAAG